MAWFLEGWGISSLQDKIPTYPYSETHPASLLSQKALFIFKFAAVTDQHSFTTFLPEQRGDTSEQPFKAKCLADSASRESGGGEAAEPTASSSQMSSHTHALFTTSFRAKFKMQTGFLITYKGLPDLEVIRQGYGLVSSSTEQFCLPTRTNKNFKVTQNQRFSTCKIWEDSYQVLDTPQCKMNMLSNKNSSLSISYSH